MRTALSLIVMPRSRSRSSVSSTCSFISRFCSMPVASIRRSASVDLPWSMWATMQKLRMRSSCTASGFGRTANQSLSIAARSAPHAHRHAAVFRHSFVDGENAFRPWAVVKRRLPFHPRMADTRLRADLVAPASLSALGRIEIIARWVVEGFLTGLHKSPRRGFSVGSAEHRSYQPGDDLRYLDGKVVARADKWLIKQFEEETNLKATIVLDVSRSM